MRRERALTAALIVVRSSTVLELVQQMCATRWCKYQCRMRNGCPLPKQAHLDAALLLLGLRHRGGTPHGGRRGRADELELASGSQQQDSSSAVARHDARMLTAFAKHLGT